MLKQIRNSKCDYVQQCHADPSLFLSSVVNFTKSTKMLKKKKPQEILLNITEFNEIRKREKIYGEIVHIFFCTSNHVIIDFTSEIDTNLTTDIDLLDQK